MIELLVTLLLALLPPCQQEDGAWCTWDATEQGNGQGASYVALWPRDPAPFTIEVN